MNSQSEIERQILEYLEVNSEARDTLRGVAEWWILRQRIAQKTSEVECALAKLVKAGRLGTRKGPDGQVHYFSSRKNDGRRRK